MTNEVSADIGSKKPAPKKKPVARRTSGQQGKARAGQSRGRNTGRADKTGAATFNQIKLGARSLNESRQNFGGQGIPTYGIVGAGIWLFCF